jgi:3-oxoacyl-[acyl-carrier-protein] synthase II
MRNALDQAGLSPDQVDYVNAHGTGTPANDSAERKAVDALFAGQPDLPMSSTKSQIGHTLGAAGAIEAAVCALALRDRTLPPTVNVDPSAEPTRDIVPNLSRQQDVDVVVSNSFAFGGNNCSLVLGREPGEPLRRPDRRVVVSGAGVVSPLGVGRPGLVQALADGAVAVRAARSVDTSRSRTHLAAEIADDGYRRYVDRAYARRLDPLGLLVLAASRLALQDAGYKISRAGSETVGMVFGTFTGPMQTVAALSETIGTEGPHRVNPRLFPNSVMNAAAGHACLSLQIRGPLSTLAIGTASGLVGLGYAVDQVRHGAAEVMLAVSADELTPLLHLGFDKLGVLSGDGSRPYDRARSGCVLGAGAAALVVESLEHALERGAPILAEVTGYAVTADAYRVAGNDPSGEAWAESFRRALADAGISARDVGTVYGDARGVAVIDLAEARAVGRVWRPGEVTLANLSGQLGHLHSTTPLMSVVSATETLRTGWVPEVRGVSDPLPEAAGYLAPRADAADRSCVVTAANWGGTYASTVLSRWVAPDADG